MLDISDYLKNLSVARIAEIHSLLTSLCNFAGFNFGFEELEYIDGP